MEEIVRKSPFLRLFLFLSIGIILGQYLIVTPEIFLVASFVLLCVLLITYFRIENYRHDMFWGGTMNLTMFFTGLYLAGISTPPAQLPTFEKKVLFYAEIEQVDIKQDDFSRYTARLLKADSLSFANQKIKLRLVVQGDTSFDAGSIFVCYSVLRFIENRGEVGEFDYKTWANRKGIFYSSRVTADDIKVIGYRSPNLLVQIRNRTKNYLFSIYDKYAVPTAEKAVLTALTTGDKILLDTGLRSSFSTAGLMHILAVSGLHVGIIYLVILWLLKPLSVTRKGKALSVLLSILLLFSYAFFTGMTPSVLRASLMFSFLIVGQALGRKYGAINSLFASAFFLTLFNPLIIFELGFQLSYLAVLSIFLFYQPLNSLVYFGKWLPDKIWSLCALAIAAQIGTTPISLYYFNQFPTYFLLGNLLIVPLVGIVIQLALVFIAFSFYEPIATLLVKVLNFLLGLITSYADWVSALPLSKLDNIYFDRVILLLLYLLVFAAYGFYVHKRPRQLITLSTFLLMMVVYLFLFTLKSSQRREIFATRDFTPTLIMVDKTGFSTISCDSLIDTPSIKQRLSGHYRQNINPIGHRQCVKPISLWMFGEERILYAPHDNYRRMALRLKTVQDIDRGFFRRGETIMFRQ